MEVVLLGVDCAKIAQSRDFLVPAVGMPNFRLDTGLEHINHVHTDPVCRSNYMKFTRLESESLSEATPMKTYQKPTIATFGSVSQLTRGVGGSTADKGQSNNTKHGKG